MSIVELGIAGYSLRPWRDGDAPSMQRHINNPKIAPNMADWYPRDGYTLELAERWVTHDHIAVGGTTWAVDCDGDAVGGAGVHPEQGFARCNTEIGYWLGEAHWGRGVGTAVVRALARAAFANAYTSRVYAPIFAHNAASQRVCEKNGFVKEGLQRQAVIKWGRPIDRVIWAAYRD